MFEVDRLKFSHGSALVVSTLKQVKQKKIELRNPNPYVTDNANKLLNELSFSSITETKIRSKMKNT